MKVIDLKQIKKDCVEEIADILYKEVDSDILERTIDEEIDTLGDDVFVGNLFYRYSTVLEKLNKEKYDEEWNRILYDIAEDVYYEITDSVQSYKKFGIEFIGKN